MVSVSQVRTIVHTVKDEEDRKVSTDTTEATGIPFDPVRAQGHGVGQRARPLSEAARAAPGVPGALGPIDLGEGADEPRSEPTPAGHRFGFDEAVQVLRDNETFSSTRLRRDHGHW